MRKINIILLAICIMVCVSPVIAVSQTVSFTQTATWTCPSDVNTVNLKMIGGGGGGMGGYGFEYEPKGGDGMYIYYAFGNGPGGHAGTYIEKSNVPVVPGQSYLITIGAPGSGSVPIRNSVPASYTYNFNGKPGSNTSAFGYTAAGAIASSMSTTNTASAGSYSIDFNGQTSIGNNGYGNYQISSTGSTGLAGFNYTTGLVGFPGSIGGIGYGAGGGGGGAGAADTVGQQTGGIGGNGAYGYAEITYDSASTSVILTGQVIDAYTSAAISGAQVNATQSGVMYSSTSAADGSFTINNAALTYGVPITTITNKSSYASDINTFTPLSSGVINLTIPLIPTAQYSNTHIVGIVRDSLYGNPISSATYYAQDTTTSAISTATSNTNGLAIVTGLTSDHFYYVWANKTGYSSPSPVLAKPYS